MEDPTNSRAANPSRVTLPKLVPNPGTVLAFLRERFPRIKDWESRMAGGLVRVEGGGALEPASPYRVGLQILYFREVKAEPEIPFQAKIIFRDAHILVVDKPHFIPVTPSGPYVRASLLAWVQEETGLLEATPIHRLDRETAGLVLFSMTPQSRASFSELFSAGRITKTYQAIAALKPGLQTREWHLENRIEKDEPFFRMACVEGPPNARSHIRLIEARDGYGLFEINPATGKKHQIRLHMAAIGFPILNDSVYPELKPEAPLDFTRPLQLLAKRLEFVDPISGETRLFESQRELVSVFS